MTPKRRMNFVLASVAVAIAAAVGGMTSSPPANADSAVTVPLNTPFTSKTVTYTITSASTKPDVDGKIRLDMVIKADNNGKYDLNFWDSTFRLRVGTDQIAPQSRLDELVEGNSSKTGSIWFVLPSTTTAATFIILFDPPKEVPITFNASSIPAVPGSQGGDGVTVPLNTPFSSGTSTWMITSATAKPDVGGKVKLDLGVNADNQDRYDMDFSNSTFRLLAGTETYAPTSCSCQLVAANSTQNGTLSFLVPSSITAATLAIKFAGGDKSVPITLNAIGGTPPNGPASAPNGP